MSTKEVKHFTSHQFRYSSIPTCTGVCLITRTNILLDSLCRLVAATKQLSAGFPRANSASPSHSFDFRAAAHQSLACRKSTRSYLTNLRSRRYRAPKHRSVNLKNRPESTRPDGLLRMCQHDAREALHTNREAQTDSSSRKRRTGARSSQSFVESAFDEELWTRLRPYDSVTLDNE